MPLPAKREQRQLTRKEWELARRRAEGGMIIDAQWQEVTLGVIEREAPRRKPFPLLQALFLLVFSAVAWLIARAVLPEMFKPLAPVRPPTGDLLALVGWLFSWFIDLLFNYEGALWIVMCALAPLAVIELFWKWRRGQ
jgi:hypothetical protein